MNVATLCIISFIVTGKVEIIVLLLEKNMVILIQEHHFPV